MMLRENLTLKNGQVGLLRLIRISRFGTPMNE